MQYELVPREELQTRIARFQQALREKGLAGALILQSADLFYFTGTIQFSRLFVPVEGEPVLAVQGNFERVSKESALKNILPVKSSKQLAEALSNFNYSLKGKIGLEMDVLPVKNYIALCKDFPGADFQDVSEIIRKIRMVKSDYELTQIRKGCEVQKKVMDLAQKIIQPGMMELEVDSQLTALARRSGHQGRLRMRGFNQEMFNAHVLAGKSATNASFLIAPLGGVGTTPAIAQGGGYNKIAENQPVIIDFGVGINGYVTDMTRTFVVGRLPEDLLKAYDFALEVKHFMEDWVKPGRLCSALYKDILKLAHQSGFQENFMGFGSSRVSFIGHGIGLEIDEFPLVAPGFHEEFQPNMVFAFEPKLVYPEIGAVGLEDDYAVTATGVELLTDYDDRILTINS